MVFGEIEQNKIGAGNHLSFLPRFFSLYQTSLTAFLIISLTFSNLKGNPFVALVNGGMSLSEMIVMSIYLFK